MKRIFLAGLAAVILPVTAAQADPAGATAEGAWKDGTPFQAIAEDNGEAIRLLITETMASGNLNPVVDNQAISSFTPGEGASYSLTTEADGTLALAIVQPDDYGGVTRQMIAMRADVADVQVVAYDVTTGTEGAVPDFHCKLDLVAGNAVIESGGNAIESPFSGAPADQTAVRVWTDSTSSDIGGCINPG